MAKHALLRTLSNDTDDRDELGGALEGGPAAKKVMALKQENVEKRSKKVQPPVPATSSLETRAKLRDGAFSIFP